ncbi:MAG: O-antigen ligase family protein [Thermodesulfobacteriota bacterium]
MPSAKAPSAPTLFTVLAVLAALAAGLALATPTPWLGLAPGLALAMAMLLARRPGWAFLAFVFVIPFGSFRTLSPEMEYLRIHWLLAGGLLLYAFFRHLPQKTFPHQIRSGLWIPVLIYLAANAVATSLSPYPETTLKELSLLCAGFSFVALAMYFIDAGALRSGLPNAVIWSNTLSSLLAMAGYFLSIPLFAMKTYEGGFKRGLGGAPDPNNMALMINFTMPFLAAWLFRGRSPKQRVLAVGLMIVNCLGLVTTFSRGGTLVLALTGLLVLFEHRRRFNSRLMGLFLAGGMAAAAVTLALVPPEFWERQASLVTDEDDQSLGRRASYLAVAKDSFLEKPFLGWGTGAFRDIYEGSEIAQRFAREGRSNRRHAHNTYAEVLVGAGLLGLALFLGILRRALRSLGRGIAGLRAAGDQATADAVATLRTSFLSLLLYMLIFSDIYHKYLLIALGAAEAARRIGERAAAEAGHGG